VVEVTLTDVSVSLPLSFEVEVRIIPEFYPSLTVEVVEVKLTDVSMTPSLSVGVKAKLGDVAVTQLLVETVTAA